MLHPELESIGSEPDDTTLARLHHQAHEVCLVANSAKTTVAVASAKQAVTPAIDRQES